MADVQTSDTFDELATERGLGAALRNWPASGAAGLGCVRDGSAIWRANADAERDMVHRSQS